MNPHRLGQIRWLLALFMAGVVASGITAFPLLHELDLIARVLTADGAEGRASGIVWWILHVREGLRQTYAVYPFVAYGTDWLAFGHLAIALFFVGPWRDPIRNRWCIQAGLIACAGVIPLAAVCGPLRGIPIYWRLIDCSFGVCGAIPLFLALRLTPDRDSETAVAP